MSKCNFAPISSRDDVVFGAHRPGFLPNEENEKPGAVDDALVADWCKFMQSQVFQALFYDVQILCDGPFRAQSIERCTCMILSVWTMLFPATPHVILCGARPQMSRVSLLARHMCRA